MLKASANDLLAPASAILKLLESRSLRKMREEMDEEVAPLLEGQPLLEIRQRNVRPRANRTSYFYRPEHPLIAAIKSGEGVEVRWPI